jgi:hypothetical protein
VEMLFLITKEQLLPGTMHFCNRGTTYLVITSKSSHMMASFTIVMKPLANFIVLSSHMMALLAFENNYV